MLQGVNVLGEAALEQALVMQQLDEEVPGCGLKGAREKLLCMHATCKCACHVYVHVYTLTKPFSFHHRLKDAQMSLAWGRLTTDT